MALSVLPVHSTLVWTIYSYTRFSVYPFPVSFHCTRSWFMLSMSDVTISMVFSISLSKNATCWCFKTYKGRKMKSITIRMNIQSSMRYVATICMKQLILSKCETNLKKNSLNYNWKLFQEKSVQNFVSLRPRIHKLQLVKFHSIYMYCTALMAREFYTNNVLQWRWFSISSNYVT